MSKKKGQPQVEDQVPVSTDIYTQTLLEMIDKEYVLFCKKTDRGLKMDYPELSEVEEFKSMGNYDMLFTWAWACASSPFQRLDKEDKLPLCIQYAYPKSQHSTKLQEFSKNIPDGLKRGIERMRRYSKEARVEGSSPWT
jgi:hypothetical protein